MATRWTPPPPRRPAPATLPRHDAVRVEQRRRSPLRLLFRLLSRWTIPIVAGVTPVGLILINIAVYVNDHLQELRWVITVMAFVSGMMLNTWIALAVYRWVQRRWPRWRVVSADNQEIALVVGIGVVTVYSFLSALFCYLNLGDTKHLPNKETFLYGVVQIVWPFLMKIYTDLDSRRRRGREAATTGGAAAHQTPTVRGSASPSRSGSASATGGGGGYVPPGYLPPS